jgi:Raf kinase inhibitor-like YbhB/YbcL family protein
MIRRFLVVLGVIALIGVMVSAPEASARKRKGILLQSTSFRDGDSIPDKYTCKKDNISPELNWKNPPAKTQSFALVVEDPDAPTQTWVHWVIFNIPLKQSATMANTFELVEGFPRDEKTREGIIQGQNDFKKIGYDGPCPPSGQHRYYFKLYALDSMLNLPAGAMKSELLKAMAKHILGWTQIMGLYGK